MSDTPRTDTFLADPDGVSLRRMREFARQLERELAEAKEAAATVISRAAVERGAVFVGYPEKSARPEGFDAWFGTRDAERWRWLSANMTQTDDYPASWRITFNSIWKQDSLAGYVDALRQSMNNVSDT